jgi:hypothetical protein
MYLLRRVWGLLTAPGREWETIAAEPDEAAGICQSYVGVLALIPAVAPLVGLAVLAGRFLGAAAITTALTAAMVTWVLAVGGTVASATIIEKLSPVFDGEGGLTQAVKLVAYAATPFWLTTASYAVDPKSVIVAAGAAWGATLLYFGAAPVMKVSERRAGPFAAMAVVAIVAANAVLRLVFTAFRIPYFGY